MLTQNAPPVLDGTVSGVIIEGAMQDHVDSVKR